MNSVRGSHKQHELQAGEFDSAKLTRGDIEAVWVEAS